MDLHVSSVVSCELVSMICAVKVIISGVISGCVSPPQYQLLALQGERLYFFSFCSLFILCQVHLLGDTMHVAVVTPDLAS